MSRPRSVRPEVGQHVHLVAIGGVGMSALAGLLQARGFRVSGSDQGVYPPASDLLEELSIEVRPGYRPEHVADADVVVIGNAVTRENPAAQAALAKGIPITSFPQILGDLFLEERRSLVVAGTHGKTTTSAMLAWVLDRAGLAPGYLIGGAPLNMATSFTLGTGEYFVVEGDEYDCAFFDKRPKFLHYRPHGVILNAVEFDHADIYRDLSHVKQAFRQLTDLLEPETPFVVASDFPHAVEVARGGRARPVFFGGGPESTWRAIDLRDDGERTSFTVEVEGLPLSEVRLRVPGGMNVRNALGVFSLCHALGLRTDAIVEGLESFGGVRRRQEKVGERGGVVVIDDFAHHPTAIQGTLAALTERYAGRRLVAVFEPRSNTSRRRVFQQEFADALATAPVVVLSAVYEKPNDPLPASERLSTEALVRDLVGRGVDARVLSSPDAIIAHLVGFVRSGDVVVVMSNGAFEGLPRRLVEAIGGA